MTKLAYLPDRGVIAVTGEDRMSFLQGLVSNDVTEAAPDRAVWTALLTPQGKWLADFFVLTDGTQLLLDVERAQTEMLLQRLGRFRLRSKVALVDASEDWHVHVVWGHPPAPAKDAIIAPDPRLPDAGWRILARASLPVTADAAAWDSHRLALGLPAGSADLESEKTVLMEAGFDELHGISWTKGCYMGQELTARTRYRGLVKRRLIPVVVEGALPGRGAPVLRGDAEVGTMRSGRHHAGLALLRLEVLESGELLCGGSRLVPHPPSWMRLPESQRSDGAG